MDREEWSRVLVRAVDAHALWQAAIVVAESDEQEHMATVDALFEVLVRRLEELQQRPLAHSQRARLEEDLRDLHQGVEQVLRLPAAARSGLVAMVFGRLFQALKDTQAEPEVKQVDPQAAETSSSPTLVQYERDAAAQTRLMWAYAATSFLLTAFLVYLTLRLTSLDSNSHNLSVPLGALAFSTLLTLGAAHQTQQCRKSAFETKRIYRQLLSIDHYLAPLPPAAQSLLRAVMLQRLFPRLIDDENPTREDEVFPSTADIMAASDPIYEAALARKLASKSQTSAGSTGLSGATSSRS